MVGKGVVGQDKLLADVRVGDRVRVHGSSDGARVLAIVEHPETERLYTLTSPVALIMHIGASLEFATCRRGHHHHEEPIWVSLGATNGFMGTGGRQVLAYKQDGEVVPIDVATILYHTSSSDKPIKKKSLIVDGDASYFVRHVERPIVINVRRPRTTFQ